MKTTIMTIEHENKCYYFDLHTRSKRVTISYYEIEMKTFASLETALIWFISHKTEFKVKNIDTNFIHEFNN